MNFVTDGLGSTIALTNFSGASVTQYDYEPFGFPTSSGSANSNPYQFTGREYDPVVAAAGLYYMRGRYYSSRLQRFISMDPLRLSAGDVNFYRYAGNDPVDLTDPTGLQADRSADDIDITGYIDPTMELDQNQLDEIFGDISIEFDQNQLDEIFDELRALGFLTGVNLAGMGGGGTPSGGVPSFVSASQDGDMRRPMREDIPPGGELLFVSELRKAPEPPPMPKVSFGTCALLVNGLFFNVPVGCVANTAGCILRVPVCVKALVYCSFEAAILGGCYAQAHGRPFPELPEPP